MMMNKKILIGILALVTAVVLISGCFAEESTVTEEQLEQKRNTFQEQYKQMQKEGYDTSEISPLLGEFGNAGDKGDAKKMNQILDEMLAKLNEIKESDKKLPPAPESANKTGDIKTCLYYFNDDVEWNEWRYKTAAAYDLIILTETNSNPEVIKKIKSYNPDAKILLYTVATQIVNPKHEWINELVHPSIQKMYWYAEKNHPEWFVRDKNGEMVYASYYQKIWLYTDPTTGWADYYAADAKKRVTNEYDGVYSDVSMTYEQVKEMANEKEWKNDPGENKWNDAIQKMLDNTQCCWKG